MKNSKLLFAILVIILLPKNLFSEPIDKATAISVARNYYAAVTNKAAPPALVTYQAQFSSSLLSSDALTAYYVVNFADEGFVIVSADDRVRPILGYSDQGAFDRQLLPDNLQFMLDEYTREIQAIVESPSTDNSVTGRAWKLLESGAYSPSKFDRVGPFVTSSWSQLRFYNNACPVDANAQYGHALVGCGAVVMGQVMRYWKFPETGQGSHSYNSNYGLLHADFGNTTYDYEHMPNRLNANSTQEQIDAVSTLLYHCGVAVNMTYGPSASWSNSNNIVAAMSTYFKYPETIEYLERNSTTSTHWWDLIKGELDSLAPFFYGGSGSQGGHVFVCDGYNEDNDVHINWGFGGSYDGFYAVTALNPGGYSFSSNQAIIIGIRGPEVPGSAVTEHAASQLTLYPNPATDIIRIDAGNLSIRKYSVYDVYGKLLYEEQPTDAAAQYDMSSLPSGVYLIEVRTESGKEVRKVVKR